MNKKFYVFLTLIALIIFPFFLQGAERAPISPDKLKIEPPPNFLPKKDNYVNVTVTFPSDAVRPGGSVKFSLLSSSWPGYCMNKYFRMNPAADFNDDFDDDDRNTAFDMSFIPANQPDVPGASWVPNKTNTDKIQEITLKFGNDAENLPASVDLRIESYDYGAIAKLHVSISYNDVIQAENSAMVPIDEDCNFIADYWQEKGFHLSTDPNFVGPLPAGRWEGTATDDLEVGPHKNTQKGDGITAVEEYRGFYIGGVHRRTSPLRKDIFLISDSELSMYGYGWADQLPRIFDRHTVHKSELWNFRDDGDKDTSKNTALNFLVCEDLHVLTQRAIWAHYSDVNDGDNHFGETESRTSFAPQRQGPSRIESIDIRYNEINEAVNAVWKNTVNQNYKGNTTEELFKWTLGHEIGHCLYLPHVTTANRHVTFTWGEDIYDANTGTYSDRTSTTTLESRAADTVMKKKAFIPKPTLQGGHWRSIIEKVGYPDYLDTLYQLVPSTVTAYDLEVYKSAPMPDFKAWEGSDGSSLTNNDQLQDNNGNNNRNDEINTQNDQDNGNDDIDTQNTNNNGNGGSTTTTTSGGDTPNPVTLPTAPRQLSRQRGNASVALKWMPPESDGGGVVTYEVQYAASGALSWNTVHPAGTLLETGLWGYVVESLTNGTEYMFRVLAKNSAGYSPASNQVTATPVEPTKKPDPVEQLTAQAGNQEVTLRWRPPTDDGNAPIIRYDYQYYTVSGVIKNRIDWAESTPTSTPGSTELSHTVSNLTNGTEYHFVMRAVNRIGESDASNEASATPRRPIYAPDAPSSITAIGGDALILFGWGKPASNGGSPITTYKYKYRPTGGTWSSNTSHAVGIWRLAVITGLTNETEYEIEVWAVNRAGAGAAISTTATPTAKTGPSAPQNLEGFSRNGAVLLWWDTPTDDGGSPITDYEYNYREQGSNWNGWASAGNADEEFPEYTVTGLTNGTTYDFLVRAKNAIKTGTSTDIISVTPAAEKPERVTGVSASTGTASGTIDLTWTAPDDNGSPITDYTYAYGRRVDGRWKWVYDQSVGSASTSHTVTGLESGVLYRLRVKAVNSVGSSRTYSRYAQAYAK